MAVRELYEEGGFDIDAEFQEVPDHVAVELEFLYLLIFKQNDARQAGREAELTSLQTLQSQFLSQHLGAWIGPFAAAVTAHAQTSFYRDLAELTERFVRLLRAAPRALPLT